MIIAQNIETFLNSELCNVPLDIPKVCAKKKTAL